VSYLTPADLPSAENIQGGSDLIEEIVNKLRKNYYEFIDGKYSIEEFWSQFIFLSLKKLSTDPQTRNLLGENNIQSLDLLLINIGRKVEDFKRENDIGNKDEARKLANEIKATSSKIINQLSEICVSLKYSLSTEPTTNATESISSVWPSLFLLFLMKMQPKKK
jgi:hypothetical protein